MDYSKWSDKKLKDSADIMYEYYREMSDELCRRQLANLVMTPSLSALRQVLHLNKVDKIEAIKELKSYVAGMNLVTAKYIIEKWMSEFTYGQSERDSEKSI
jgi:hypothetical protein